MSNSSSSSNSSNRNNITTTTTITYKIRWREWAMTKSDYVATRFTLCIIQRLSDTTIYQLFFIHNTDYFASYVDTHTI